VNDEMTHQGNQGDFGNLALREELLIPDFQNGMALAGDQGGLVKSFARQGSAAADKTAALPAALLCVICLRSRRR
jgi:hypothetical protein